MQAVGTLDPPRADTSQGDRSIWLRDVARVAAVVGGPLFLLGVVLHPPRDGYGVASVGDVYGITHGVQAIGLLLQVISLGSVLALGPRGVGRGGAAAWLTAQIGTVLWFGLISIDGTHNPVLAHYAPEVVHTPADFSPGVLFVFLPAQLLFPLGYVLLGRALAHRGALWQGVLLGFGACVYATSGPAIFALGPSSPVIQILELIGAVPYALGFVLLGQRFGPRLEPNQ